MNLTRGDLLRRSGAEDVAVLVAHLLGTGMRHPVGRHYAVAVEGLVGIVVGVEVAAEHIDPRRLAGGIGLGAGAVPGAHLALRWVIGPAEGLVHEVPDAAALERRIAAHQVPVLGKTAEGIAHCVRILTLNQRLGRIAGAVFLTVLVARIHRAVDVGMVVELRPFILHGAGLVEGLRPFVGLLEIGTVAGLVAKAPDDDAGMVEVAADHTLHPYHMGGCKVVALCKRLLAVAHSVRLDVGLVDDIQAVAVAELVPEGVVGVVAGTYSVDIQLLHHAHVAQHLLSRHAVRPVRAHLVTVHALDEYGPAVDQQLRVLDFHAAETHVQAGGFHGLAPGERAHAEGVEIGLLGAPEPRVFEVSVPAGTAAIDLFRPADDAAVGRCEFIKNGVGTGLHGHVEVVFTFHIRVHAHVAKGSALCPEVQAHAAGYAAEAPEVLALKVSAVAPAHYLKCD